MQRITKLDNDLTCKGMLMKLWNKTLLASALCLTLFGCDDASKVDNKLDKAKDNAEQMKDAAADKAQAIKQDADKQIDTLKSQADAEADRLKDQASAIKAEADKKADAIAQQAKAQADAVKQNAKQESDRIVKEAGQIKDNAIGDANQLSAEAASKTKAIQDSIAKDKQNAAPPAAQQYLAVFASPAARKYRERSLIDCPAALRLRCLRRSALAAQ